ncbi:MAG: OmpH family outer membrane protein [Desulfatiglandales bacterium]|nr:OmpH family outer membrane protein [Desulfatiglandales bacterium]
MKHFFLLILGMPIMFCFQYSALGADPPKIGVVDIQKLQNKSMAIQKAKAILKKKFNAKQKRLDKEKNELHRIEEEFKKQSMMLSLDAKEDKKREVEKKKRFYKYFFEELSQEMKDDEVETKKRIGKELEKIVIKIGKKEGYTLIFEKRALGLLFFSDAIDITDQMTKEYDRMKQ